MLFSKLMKEILYLLFLGQYRTSCTEAQYTMDLNEWLTDFSDCHVAIIVIGSKRTTHVGNFDYPIRLRRSRFIQRFNFTNSLYQKIQPRFCTLEVTIILKRTIGLYYRTLSSCRFGWAIPDKPSRISISGLTNVCTNSFSFNICYPKRCQYQ